MTKSRNSSPPVDSVEGLDVGRRRFHKLLGGSMLGAATGSVALGVAQRAAWAAGSGTPKVVVVGGGAGGATAARYIAKDAAGAVNVTLINDNKEYTTCFYSNLFLGGYRTMESITHSYDKLANDYGINVVNAMATGVDGSQKTVATLFWS